MKQAVMTSPGQITFHEVPTPRIESDEALVRPIRIGVCGSDIHVYHGKHPYTSYPVVQGHEVSAVGEAARSLGSRCLLVTVPVVDAIKPHVEAVVISLREDGLSRDDLKVIADNSQVLPDCKSNPRVATRDEIYEILGASHRR
jgi:NADPH:quinone reductase-like Zn-dependent oxidoreductase